MFRNLNILQVIVMVVIIVFSTATLGLAFLSAKSETSDKQQIANISKISQALKIYFDENGFYPQNNGNAPKEIEKYLDFYPSSRNAECQYNYERKAGGSDYALTFCLGKNAQMVLTSKDIL